MKLFNEICILLLINFASDTLGQEFDIHPCITEYLNLHECYRRFPNGDHLFREINSTSQTYTGSVDDIDTLRVISQRYCDSGFRYLQCFDNVVMKSECHDTESVTATNQVFADNLIKFAIEYTCRNDAEAVFKITANNGLKSIMNMDTAEVLQNCTSTNDHPHSSSLTETFCSNVDDVSECILRYSDQLPNQDISSIIRDVIPQLKVIGKCAPVIET